MSPIVRVRLPIKTEARIPWRVAAPKKPAPIRRKGKSDHSRTTKRAGQMHNRGVDADHQVEVGDRGGRVGEVLELTRLVLDGQAQRRGPREIGGARADLK